MDLEGEDLLWSMSCAGIFLEGLEKKPLKNLRISGVSTKIRTGHLPNICLERYSTNTLCISCARNDDWLWNFPLFKDHFASRDSVVGIASS